MGCSMISEGVGAGVDLITLPYLLNIFGKTGLRKQYRCRSDAAEAASDQDLHSLHSSSNFTNIHKK